MEPQENKPSAWEVLKLRLVTGVCLLVVVICCLEAGGVVFSALMILAAILAMKEWETLTQYQMLLLRYAGYAYVVIPSSSLIWIRTLTTQQDVNLGLNLILSLVAIVSATDICAYLVGKFFGHHKMAPNISPNKTWEGVVGGFIGALAAGVLFLPYTHLSHNISSAITISTLLSTLAQLGDLFESWIKRKANVKDSGTLLPGHGGVLDRLDGYMFAAPAMALLAYNLQG